MTKGMGIPVRSVRYFNSTFLPETLASVAIRRLASEASSRPST